MTSQTLIPAPTTEETSTGFDLDVTIVERVDPGSLVNVTNDNCGSTCGACTTGCA